MYFRMTTLADLAARVMSLSRAELAARLGVAASTFYSYRTATRFPEKDRSTFRHALARVLAEAAEPHVSLDADRYVLSALYAEDRLFVARKHFLFAFSGLEETATRIALDLLPFCPPAASPVDVLKALVAPVASAESKGLAAWWAIVAWGEIEEVEEGRERFSKSTLELPSLISPKEILLLLHEGRFNRRFRVPEMAAMDVVLAVADQWAVVEERHDPPNAGEGPLLRLRLRVSIAEKVYETEGRVVSDHYGLR